MLVACSLWRVESCQRVCSLISILIEMYMYVLVYVYGCLNISVPVSVHAHACANGSFVMCVSKGKGDTVKCCPPPAGLASPSSVLSGRHVLGWAVPTTRGLRGMSIWHPGHGRHAQRRRRPPMLRLVHVLFVVCCCVGVPVADVGTYVCGPACCVDIYVSMTVSITAKFKAAKKMPKKWTPTAEGLAGL